MSVSLRKRKLASGKTRLYLDITLHGKRWYEGLDLFLGPSRDENKQILRLAQIARSKRELELFANSKQIPNIEAEKGSFISFFAELAKEKHKSWRATLIHLLNFESGRLEFRHITPEWLEDFKKHLSNQVSPNSANLYFSKIVAALHIAQMKGHISSNPADSVQNVRRVTTMKNYLTFPELEKLAKADCDQVDVKLAFLFGCYTGLRLCDIRKLQKSSILPNMQIELRQTKTKEPIYLPIPETAYNFVSAKLQGEGPLFDLPESEGTLWTYIQHWISNSGIKKHISFGVSRHTFATLALANGADLFVVSKLLGHTDVRHTQVYAKIMDSTKREAVDRLPSISIS